MDGDRLTLTQTLTALQNYLMKDGSISPEHQYFYKEFRNVLNEDEHTEFDVTQVRMLLEKTHKIMDNVTDEDFQGMVQAVLTQYSNDNDDALNERIERWPLKMQLVRS